MFCVHICCLTFIHILTVRALNVFCVLDVHNEIFYGQFNPFGFFCTLSNRHFFWVLHINFRTDTKRTVLQVSTRGKKFFCALPTMASPPFLSVPFIRIFQHFLWCSQNQVSNSILHCDISVTTNASISFIFSLLFSTQELDNRKINQKVSEIYKTFFAPKNKYLTLFFLLF